MSDRINRKGGVVKDNGGNEEAPNQGGHARQSGKGLKPGSFTEEVATEGKGKDGNPIKTVDEAQFRELEPIWDFFEEGGNRVIRHEPQGVTPK